MQPVGKQLCHVPYCKKTCCRWVVFIIPDWLTLISTSWLPVCVYTTDGIYLLSVCVRVIEHFFGDRLPPTRWPRRSPYDQKLRLLHSRPLGHVVTSTTCSWSLNAINTCNVNTKQLRIFFSVCNVVAILFLQWLSRAQLSWHIECSFCFF